MPPSNISHATSHNDSKLPRKDWILLPLLSLLTLCLLAGILEFSARILFSSRSTSLKDCMVLDDPTTGVRGIPNSICPGVKSEESQPVEYKFDSCGHRSGMVCGSKTTNVYRIAMVGSSTAMGSYIPYEQTFATLLPGELSQQTKHNVELYNEGMQWEFPRVISLHFKDTLARKPDAVLWIVSPWDVENSTDFWTQPEKSKILGSKLTNRLRKTLVTGSFSDLLRSLRDSWGGYSRIAMMFQHYIYESQSEYVKLYLMGGDVHAGFLKVEQSDTWKLHLHAFDAEAAEIESQANAAGVPLIVILIPSRVQSAMISMGKWPDGYDPYKLSNQIRQIITSHGGTYVDILPQFRTIPNPEQFYFPVDGHPNSSGGKKLTEILAHALLEGQTPAIRITKQSQPVSIQGR